MFNICIAPWAPIVLNVDTVSRMVMRRQDGTGLVQCCFGRI